MLIISVLRLIHHEYKREMREGEKDLIYLGNEDYYRMYYKREGMLYLYYVILRFLRFILIYTLTLFTHVNAKTLRTYIFSFVFVKIIKSTY